MGIGIVRRAYKDQRHYIVSLMKTAACFMLISYMYLRMYSIRIFDIEIEDKDDEDWDEI